ncbi:F-box domain [Arabidopsis thaliana x Arabidopsis arenosa]|uniref:F-box domain n=1 Tax=Arabidopsis thaliana x Arabidopsis arenosa TaxID=1240361 RepID=A0A8T2AA02_9BRAS|nr:F-box domain [Arabidopsis thaliana x Arabidopsis arenosa]
MSSPRDDNGWSKLYPDLLRSIFESLGCLDFHRARTVCSNWYAVSRTCPLYPWRIVIRGKNSVLFDPIQDKIYTKNLLGIDFSKIHCLASYGNWILIVDTRLDFHLLNVFTRERINLPSLESLLRGDRPFRFIRNDDFGYFLELYGTKFLLTWNDFRFEKTAILWVNGRNGDYIVAWAIKQFYIFSYKKIGNDDVGDGDDDKRWSITCTQCEDMAYKDNKLYVYTFDHYINIFDFSGYCPKETMEENPYLNHPFRFVDTIYKLRLAVTRAGEVLIVLSLVGLDKKFCIYKLNLKIGDWEIVESLGDEMLIFGHGVTIRAPGKDISGGGLKSDSICFLYDDHLSDHHLTMKTQPVCGVFDLATSTITWHTRLEDLSSKICWFVPGYA